MDKSLKRIKTYTAREIDIYRKETSLESQAHTDATNKSLILLRRRNLATVQNNERLKRSIEHFNRIVKSKHIDEVVRIIRYLLKQ